MTNDMELEQEMIVEEELAEARRELDEAVRQSEIAQGKRYCEQFNVQPCGLCGEVEDVCRLSRWDRTEYFCILCAHEQSAYIDATYHQDDYCFVE